MARPVARLIEGSWRLRAACQPADPDLFFPVSSAGKSLEQVAEATAVCARCLVRRQCLAFALRTRQVHGSWGVLTGKSATSRPQPGRRMRRTPRSGDPGRRGILPVIATAQLMVALDLTIVNVALPHIQAALGFSAWPGARWPGARWPAACDPRPPQRPGQACTRPAPGPPRCRLRCMTTRWRPGSPGATWSRAASWCWRRSSRWP